MMNSLQKNTVDNELKTIRTYIHKNGREASSPILTSASEPHTEVMYISPQDALPIIFVPGIMGSPLIAVGGSPVEIKGTNKWAWFPDDGPGWVAGFGLGDGYADLSPAQRKKLLDPAKTKAVTSVAEADLPTLKKFLEGKSKYMSIEEMAKRGWGSVSLDSYGELLLYLNNMLRYFFLEGEIGKRAINEIQPDKTNNKGEPADWGKLKGYQRLSLEDIKIAASWSYPVYAAGYNWLKSNEEGAQFLKKRIDWVLKDCRERLGKKCSQVILVTHSMGGLVARRCAQQYPELIAGVVHGVQPAIGAATAYRRVRAGWEDFAGAIGLGGTGKKIMPVFANAAGPLELLPNQLYGNGWLKISWAQDKKILSSLPKNNDPYAEIYLEKNVWWRLMDPAWIDPENNEVTAEKKWYKYTQTIELARKFHANLCKGHPGGYYHPNTYSSFGVDEKHKAFKGVNWQFHSIEKPISEEVQHVYTLSKDNYEGSCYLTNPNYRYIAATPATDYPPTIGKPSRHQGVNGGTAQLAEQDEAGDGTVPAHSARPAFAASKIAAEMSGFDHQNSYKNPQVLAFTLYSIAHLASKLGMPKK